jgi:CubicO group peptidase (beta-lactamase class C family)
MSVLITERRSERRSELDTKVGQILNRHPAVGLAVGIIGNGRLQFFHGHGLADITSNTPITEDTVLPHRVAHEDVHRDRRDAAVGTRAS